MNSKQMTDSRQCASRVAIADAQQRLLHSFEQGDAEGIAALYGDEGAIMPAHSTAIHGRAAIQAFWQGCIDAGLGSLQRRALEVDCLAETVNETGEYRVLDRNSRVVDVGKYVVIWKVQNGQWKMQHDIWTSNLPGT